MFGYVIIVLFGPILADFRFVRLVGTRIAALL